MTEREEFSARAIKQVRILRAFVNDRSERRAQDNAKSVLRSIKQDRRTLKNMMDTAHRMIGNWR